MNVERMVSISNVTRLSLTRIIIENFVHNRVGLLLSRERHYR